MKLDRIQLLACPYCRGDIEVRTSLGGTGGELEFGILHCLSCGCKYPVVEGIGILRAPHETLDVNFETTADALRQGPAVQEVLTFLERRDLEGALALLLSPTGDGWRSPDFNLSQGERQGSDPPGSPGSGFVRRVGRAIRRRLPWLNRRRMIRARSELAKFLHVHWRRLSALEFIELFYRRYSGVEIGNYLGYRFGQPRHLAVLALAPLLTERPGPLLDLACGAGHLLHYFGSVDPGRVLFGLDRDFPRLLLARWYVAPSACYVCAAGDQSLPFRSEAFSAVACSDAFHYFLQRASATGEMQRILMETGCGLIARFGNAEVEPREGYELNVANYRRLFAPLHPVFFGERELVQMYLSRKSPSSTGGGAADLQKEKWLSVVISRRASPFDLRPFSEWPHAVGRLGINPLYVQTQPRENGEVELELRFPSDWYRVENGGCLEYAPPKARLCRETLEALAKGQRTSAMQEQIARTVLVGLPEHYCDRRS